MSAVFPVIDSHTHMLPSDYCDWLEKHGSAVGIEVTRGEQGQRRIGTRFNNYPLDRHYHDVELRLETMASQGVDAQMVSMSTPHLLYWLPARQYHEVCEVQNDTLMAEARSHPEHFIPAASVPLQDADLSVQELSRCAGAGYRMVQIATNIDGRNLDDPHLEPFWTAAADLAMLIFIHPTGVVLGSDRLSQYYLRNLIGLPTETALAVASLVFGGVLDRHPALRVMVAHGGGFAPYGIARLDMGWRNRPEAQGCSQHPPSHYLRRIYFDTVVHADTALQFVADVVGASQLVLGSDYPADTAVAPPCYVPQIQGLNEDVRAGIMGGTFARLVGFGGARL